MVLLIRGPNLNRLFKTFYLQIQYLQLKKRWTYLLRIMRETCILKNKTIFVKWPVWLKSNGVIGKILRQLKSSQDYFILYSTIDTIRLNQILNQTKIITIFSNFNWTGLLWMRQLLVLNCAVAALSSSSVSTAMFINSCKYIVVYKFFLHLLISVYDIRILLVPEIIIQSFSRILSLKSLTMGGGGIKNCPKLRDVISV